MNKTFEIANSIFDEIIAIRREIHKNPEQGFKEFKTSELVQAKLKEYGVDEIICPVGTAVIGVIKGTKGSGKTVALRCDMDALPVLENTGLPFSSQVEGVMHACGHDLHVAMMLGNAKVLCSMKDEFAGTVKLIFQPSEEVQPGGSRPILETGVLDDVDAFFGMHVSPTEDEVGKILLKRGPVTTSADEFEIEIIGMGGHGSAPHKAKDAILAGCQLNVLFQQVQARNIDPLDTCIFTTNVMQGGTKSNIIADNCKMYGSVRCYTPEARAVAREKIADICRGVEKLSGCTSKDVVMDGYDACINDDGLIDTFIEAYGAENVVMMKTPMGFSEDYSFYATKTGKPSVLMFLSAGHEDGMPVATLHSANCTFNEASVPYGISAMSTAALSFLAK